MTIDQNSWHLRVYQWWYEHKYGYPNENGYTNLCPYMRAVMFWAPLRAIFGTWIKLGKIPVNAITIPLTLYGIPMLLGYGSYRLKMAVFVLYLGTLVIGLGEVILVFLGYLFSTTGKDITKPLRNKIKTSGFIDLISAYFRSAHDQICPPIHWNQGETNEPSSN